MATTNFDNAPIRTPLNDKDGSIDKTWAKFFDKLVKRIKELEQRITDLGG